MKRAGGPIGVKEFWRWRWVDDVDILCALIMRIGDYMTRASHLKKATNVSIRSDLLEAARDMKINLSKEFEHCLEEVVRKNRAEQWLKDNREAIEAYNRYVETHGIWSDEYRTW
jgi:antitoxin CcdA